MSGTLAAINQWPIEKTIGQPNVCQSKSPHKFNIIVTIFLRTLKTWSSGLIFLYKKYFLIDFSTTSDQILFLYEKHCLNGVSNIALFRANLDVFIKIITHRSWYLITIKPNGDFPKNDLNRSSAAKEHIGNEISISQLAILQGFVICIVVEIKYVFWIVALFVARNGWNGFPQMIDF